MSHLKITQNQNVVTVSLNRPEKRNAFHPEMIHEITQTFTQLKKEKDLRAVLLTGEGPSFCAGGDLEWMKSMAKYTFKQNLKDAEKLFAMFDSIRQCPIPVIARVFGHCFGGGLGLVSACDIVAAEQKTQFSFSEVKWGLVPAVISPFVVEKVAAAKLREWFLTAKVFDAGEALSGSLIQFVGNQAQVDDYLEQSLSLIQAAGPEAVRQTKKLCLSYSPINWKKVKASVTKMIAKRRISTEGQKGLSAFLEKRPPDWSLPSYGQSQKV